MVDSSVNGGLAGAGYRRVIELARGGMGSVEVVMRRDGRLGRLFAQKRLLPAHRDDAELRSMFLDEARVAGMLRHPNTIQVVDVGEDAAGPYLVMEYIEGMSVAKLIGWARDTGFLPVALCVSIAADACRGLHAAHELRSQDGTPLDLVHRDVTPQNILLGFDGAVRVADFGIARAWGNSSRTSTGLLKGNIGYMSPEQLQFRKPDRRSDLFSLGVVLYEMLTGARLYAGNNEAVAQRILDEPPPDIGQARDVPPIVVEILFDLLAKDLADRPATAAIVASRLDAIRSELVADEEPTPLTDFLAAHFADHRDEQRARLEAATRRAIEGTDTRVFVPIEISTTPIIKVRSVRRQPTWLISSLVAAIIVLGVVTTVMIARNEPAADAAPEAVPLAPNPASPISAALASPAAEARSEPSEPVAVPTAQPRANTGVRKRPARAQQRSRSEESRPASEIPRWSW